MKKSILTIGLFSLVMILTSFTTPETVSATNVENNMSSVDFVGDGLINKKKTDFVGDGLINKKKTDFVGDGLINKKKTDFVGDGLINKKKVD